MNKLKNYLVTGTFVVSLLISGVSPAFASTSISKVRLAGLDRYQTANEIAKKGWTVSNNAILAYGENYPDALASVTLAKRLSAPILLTGRDSVSSETMATLISLGVTQVFIAGGTAVVSPAVVAQLRDRGIVSVRLAGLDRYETSVRIAEKIVDSKQIVVTTGDAYADALSIGSIAGLKNMVIILVPKDYLPESVKGYLATHKMDKTYVVGDSSIVSDAVATQFPNMERITGTDKYERNVNIINKFASELSQDELCIATGENFADALTGTAYAASKSQPIILIPRTTNSTVLAFLSKRERDLKKITIFGGTVVVPNETLVAYVPSIADTLPVLVSKQIEGVGPINMYSYANISVETNFNVDLLNAMAATGSGFTHKGYLADNTGNSKLNQNFKTYFSPFIANGDAKDLFTLESTESSSGESKKYPSNVVLGMVASKEFLGQQSLYLGNQQFTRSLFRTRNLPLTGLNEIMRRFAKDTNAITFFKENKDLYNQQIDDFVKGTLTFNHVQRIQDFYGTDLSKDQFKVILTSTENGGTATDIDNGDGTKTYYNYMTPVGSLPTQLNVLYHETGHNYYRPVSLVNQSIIDQYASYKDVLGYYSPSDGFQSRLNETLARVVTICMLEQYHGKDMAYANMNGEISRGWKNIDNLYFLVKNKYLTHRDQYKTFGDFLPVILDYIKATSENNPFDIGPVEKVELPKNGLILGGREESEKLAAEFQYFNKLGSAWTDDASILASNIIVLFDYPGASNMPSNVQALFAGLKTSDVNYVNIKRNGDKLLVLIKTDSKEKAMSIVGQLESLTKEQYRVYP